MQQRRRRSVHLHVMATPGEQTKIRERMTQTDILNMGVCMRKIALNSYVLQAALSPICWRSRPRWWTCDPWERPGPLPGCLRLRTRIRRLPAGLGCNPNKHFRGAKIPSAATLALLAANAFTRKRRKKTEAAFAPYPCQIEYHRQ